MQNSLHFQTFYDYFVTLTNRYMEKSKLIDVIKTFSKEEIKSFNDFVRSPFFNKEKVLIRLADYLLQYYPLYSSPEIEKEKVFSSLYPGKRYNDGLMRNIISDLLKFAEEFLAVSAFRADNIKKELQLAGEFYNRKQWKHFQQQKEKTNSELEKDGIRNRQYYERKTELTELYLKYLRETDITSYKQTQKTLQETSDLMTAVSLIKQLFYNTYMVSFQSFFGNVNYRVNLADEIETFFRGNGKQYFQIPYIEIYYLSYKLFETLDEKYFYALKTSFLKNFNFINDADKKEIFIALGYYSLRKINEGKTEFIKEVFSLNKQEIESRVYKDPHAFLDSGSFMSVVKWGFEAGENKWTENFINNYISRVRPELQRDTLCESMAAKYYHEKNYEHSLKELAKITSGTLQLKLNIKSLTLKIYYELNETEQLYSHLDTYKHFILNNKLIHERLSGQVNNYINYSKRLFDIKNTEISEKGFELQKLKKEILDNHSLSEKFWLLKKTEELESQPGS